MLENGKMGSLLRDYGNTQMELLMKELLITINQREKDSGNLITEILFKENTLRLEEQMLKEMTLSLHGKLYLI